MEGERLPRGMRAVEVTANIRTKLYSLPYGDQCLSLSRLNFDYVGGFPDNCLMEDYDLVRLFRRRQELGVEWGGGKSGGKMVRERIGIIPGEPARCDARRWRKLGVWRTTVTNSIIVQRYGRGEDPRILFERYYGREPKEFRGEGVLGEFLGKGEEGEEGGKEEGTLIE